MPVHDPSAVAFAIDRSLFEVEPRSVRVATEGLAIGQTIAATESHSSRPGPWYDMPKTHVALDVDGQRLTELLKETLSRKQVLKE